MNKLLKWLLPLLIGAEVALVWLKVIDLSMAVWVVALVELALFAVAGRQLIAAFRRYRSGRREGMDAFVAIEEGLAVFLPRPLAKIATLEPRMYWILAKWVIGLFRRRQPEPGEFPYHRKSPMGVLIWMVLLLSPVEIGLIELLIPSHLGWLRLLLLIAGIYTVIWVIALFASLTLCPHRVGQDAIDLNYGLLFHLRLRYVDIQSLEQRKGNPVGIGTGLKIDKEGGKAYLSLGIATNLRITLVEQRCLPTLFKTTIPVKEIGFSADDPAAFIAEVQRRTAPLS